MGQGAQKKSSEFRVIVSMLPILAVNVDYNYNIK